MKRAKPDHRKCWAVEFRNSRDECMLLGVVWDETEMQVTGRRTSEPMRTLLFCTRAQARVWCRAKQAKFVDCPPEHVCRQWRFRPVRVRETVQVIA